MLCNVTFQKIKCNMMVGKMKTIFLLNNNIRYFQSFYYFYFFTIMMKSKNIKKKKNYSAVRFNGEAPKILSIVICSTLRPPND